ncbi:MAG: tyrosine-type recombinase/integrase [Ruminococcus sp.]|nr:tyrosine-type recombinase/integrase [Ruminococcus sp.]
MRRANGMGTIYKLSGNRRNPYIVRKTVGWEINEVTGRSKQVYITIGYAPTQQEAARLLNEYNENPYSLDIAKITFSEVYDKWSSSKFPTISDSNVKGYMASYKCCKDIYDRPFRELRLADLQGVVDTCGKNYPTLRKLQVLFSQMYNYAMKNEICNKDYSKYVEIAKYKNKNPDKRDRNVFTADEIERLWNQKVNTYVQIVLMLIYSGVRVGELLDLKRENVNIEDHCFNIIKSKTENGIRLVPIHDKTYPFFKKWYDDGCEYLIHTPNGEKFEYRNYYDSYWKPAMELIDSTHKPHDTRHTCISMMTEKEVSPTLIKKIVGHSGAMSLTERVYTHVNVQELLDAINKI